MPRNLVVHYGYAGMDPSSVHIVCPAGPSSFDPLDPDNLEDLTRARNLPLIGASRSYFLALASQKNLANDHVKSLHSQFMCGFVGSKSDFEDFVARPRIELSSVDKSCGFLLSEVYGWAEGYFVPGFFHRMMSTMLIGYPIVGPGELFMCAMTDYRRPTEPKGDLVGCSGYAEVKAEGRLGGQRPDRDGQQSREAVSNLLGRWDDEHKSWGNASYQWLSAALLERRRTKRRSLSKRRSNDIVRSMMNYDCDTEAGMVEAMEEDPQSFHAALHLHCYSYRRKFGEVLFLSKDRSKVTAYTGRSFGSALEFSKRNLRNRGGWGGWNQDRSGVQVEHV